MTLKNIDSNVSSQKQCSGHIGHPQTSLGSLQWDYFPLMESRSNENNLWIIQDSTDILSRNRCLYLSIVIFQHFEDDKENMVTYIVLDGDRNLTKYFRTSAHKTKTICTRSFL